MERLQCPFCNFESTDIFKLTEHVDDRHHEKKEDNSPSDKLSDSDLAQILAFQEAGLPRELALAKDVDAHESKTDGTSVVENGNDSFIMPEDEDGWADCHCGERVLLRELDIHADMHAQESISIDDITHDKEDSSSSGPTKTQKAVIRSPSGKARRRLTLRDYFGIPSESSFSATRKHPTTTSSRSKMASPKRLGNFELGPYAHERRMPDRIYQLLAENDRQPHLVERSLKNGGSCRLKYWPNQARSIVPILAHLSEMDEKVVKSRFCHYEVDHIYKIPDEGGFCGYRNIQMIISFLRNAQLQGHEHFDYQMPSIFRIQDMIEEAWDKGIHTSGKVETGGIRLTRKYIGTPEAETLFESLKIDCDSLAFSGAQADQQMLKTVSDYFRQDDVENNTKDMKTVVTCRAPIYYQHRGHSMTIVGMEWREDCANLIVFDPMFATSAAIKALRRRLRNGPVKDAARYLKAYRRGHNYLSRYNEFELLMFRQKVEASPYAETRDKFGLSL